MSLKLVQEVLMHEYNPTNLTKQCINNDLLYFKNSEHKRIIYVFQDSNKEGSQLIKTQNEKWLCYYIRQVRNWYWLNEGKLPYLCNTTAISNNIIKCQH